MDGTRHATPVIAQMNEELPDDAHLDRRACSAFIEDMVQRIPPSAAQLDYAQTLAERHGVERLSHEPAPRPALTVSGACFISWRIAPA